MSLLRSPGTTGLKRSPHELAAGKFLPSLISGATSIKATPHSVRGWSYLAGSLFFICCCQVSETTSTFLLLLSVLPNDGPRETELG